MSAASGAGCHPRLRAAAVALAVGGAAFALSCLVVAPRTSAFSMGLEFAAMAEDPFGWHGRFPHRVLGPALAWGLGLGGDRYWLFAHGTAVALLALVCFAALRSGAALAGSAVLTLAVALSGAIEVYKEHVGYAEPAAFALLLAGWLLRQRTGWFWLMALLGLLNHEGSLLLWPWLLWSKARAAGGVRRGDVAGLLATGAAYLTVRALVFAAASQPVLDANAYVGGPLTAATLGMWVLTAASIPIWFGVLPVLLAWHVRAAGWRDAGVPLLLALAGIFAMCTVATDMPRFLGYLALPVAVAGIALLQRPAGVRWLALLTALTAAAIVLQRPVVHHLVAAILARVPEPLPALVVDLWLLFAAYGVALSLMAAAGIALARRTEGRGTA